MTTFWLERTLGSPPATVISKALLSRGGDGALAQGHAANATNGNTINGINGINVSCLRSPHHASLTRVLGVVLRPVKDLKRASKVDKIKLILQGDQNRERLLISHCRSLRSHRE